MTLAESLVIILYFSFTVLSAILFGMLLHNYLKHRKDKYHVHNFTRLILGLIFFLFVQGLFHLTLYMAEFRIIPVKYFFVMTQPLVNSLPLLGIFAFTVAIIHFIMDEGIDKFKGHQDSMEELAKLNKELEARAEELQESQDDLQKKVVELEKFNDIAKQREGKMVELIKKIEKLES